MPSTFVVRPLVGRPRAGDVGHKLLQRLTIAARQGKQACRLRPVISVHSVCLKPLFLGIAPCSVNTF